MSENMETEFKVAAKWWADLLRQGHVKQDNGESDPMAQGLAHLASSLAHQKVTAAKVDQFEELLFQILSEKSLSSHRRGLGWGTDYHPDSMLSEACEGAGLGDGFMLLPIKTRCFTEPGLVRVRYGYGAPLETIFSA